MEKINGFVDPMTIRDVILENNNKKVEIAKKEAVELTQMYYFLATQGETHMDYFPKKEVDNRILKAILNKGGYKVKEYDRPDQWVISVD